MRSVWTCGFFHWIPGLTCTTLKKRSEFQRVRGGPTWGTPAFLLQVRMREDEIQAKPSGQDVPFKEGEVPGCLQNSGETGPRFGFTITKKMGNAVARNLIRRRLKAAVSELAHADAMSSCDYVLVARRGAATRAYVDLVADLAQAFERVHDGLRQKRKKRGS